jgi:hypothetical protein
MHAIVDADGRSIDQFTTSHPVPNARNPPANDSKSAMVSGAAGASHRINQLRPNNRTTTTLPMPWSAPIRVARVPEGIAHQSMGPKRSGEQSRDDTRGDHPAEQHSFRIPSACVC